MTVPGSRPYIFLLICLLLFAGLVPASGRASAEPDSAPIFSEEARQLLQDSLSIVEIDHEIKRIETRQTDLESSQKTLQSNIARLETEMGHRREQAGAVLRSYYMGERKSLLNLLLTAGSLTNFFRVMEFYDIIIQNDREVLNAYDLQYRDLVRAEADAARNAAQLAEVKDALVKQRERVLALEAQVNGALAASGKPEAMSRLIEEFTLYWENVGLYEVKRHFRALASAMNALPDFIQNSKGMMKTDGKEYTIHIHEDELNRFLRTQDEIFNTFAFRFDDGKISAEGETGNLTLLIEGQYTIVQEPENAIMFQVDKLVFNRLELPDTTRKSLQEEFDMNFYPKQLVTFVKATEVTSAEQKLTVKLELDL